MEVVQNEYKSDSQKAAEVYTELSTRLGMVHFQMDCLESEASELYVKMRNANVDYKKAKDAEVKEMAQKAEAIEREVKEVTNG